MAEAVSRSGARGYHPVWFRLIRGAVEVGTGIFCIIQQFNSTRDSVFGLLQAGTQPGHMTVAQLQQFLTLNAGKLNIIAFTIALVTQVVFWWVALPAARNGHSTRAKLAIAGGLFLLEELTDATYAASTQVAMSGDLTRVFMTGNNAWLGVVLYMICIGFGSTFVFLNGINVIGNVLSGEPD